MAERLFFALWPGVAQRLALAGVQRDLGALAPRPAGHPARWTHPEDIHLTLVFLGSASPDQRRCAEAAAGRVRATAFALSMDRVGSFPRARVLWCGTAVALVPLVELVGSLRRELGSCGFTLDQRPYAPHATLARNARPLATRLLDQPIPWPVEDFVLAAGQEGPPPRYRILGRWPLG